MTAPTPLPAHYCPLCGQPNQCAPASAGTFAIDCWCSRVQVAPESLQRLAPAQRGTACLCARCAAEAPAREGQDGSDRR